VRQLFGRTIDISLPFFDSGIIRTTDLLLEIRRVLVAQQPLRIRATIVRRGLQAGTLPAEPMPTIADLVNSGAIVKIDVDLAPRDQPLRLLYGTPQFIGWLQEVLGGAEPPRLLGHSSITEQIDDLFYSFLSGQQLIFTRQFRVVRAEENAVWELKTLDVRIFGWFMARDCFVAVYGNWADAIKDHDLYRGYRIAIRRLRRELGIDTTLCVRGRAPEDVLSVRH
jgi:hypothetical protein